MKAYHAQDANLFFTFIDICPHVVSNGYPANDEDNDQDDERNLVHQLVRFNLCGYDLTNGGDARIGQNVP